MIWPLHYPAVIDMPPDPEDDDHQNYWTIETPSCVIDVDVASPKWAKHSDLARTIETALNAITYDQKTNLAILLTDDVDIQRLNNDFRGKNKPTNVLSFPNTADDYLGDIAISYETLEKEAIEQDKDFNHHFIHMLIHGVLHLQGHDHDNDEEAKMMEQLEIKILEDMGIQNPYT